MSNPTPPETHHSRGSLFALKRILTPTVANLTAVLALALVAALPLASAQQPAPKADGKAKGKAAAPAVKPGSQTFNTVITKLKEGKQVFCNTLIDPDLEAAKKACEGQAYIWIEMQHSTIT